ncbi:putative cinnamyl-alcohol dehydrogenase [Helianthus annuus]|nr:putative cinnamyl-alcohol dehydrogenase [Helianthus annuus]
MCRKTGPEDVVFKVLYCGVDHSDLHQIRNEAQYTTYPLVPGHEVVGKVIEVGSDVKKFVVRDIVGVVCMVGSCGECMRCKTNKEQYCKNMVFTYNTIYKDGSFTQGGFSSAMIVHQKKREEALTDIGADCFLVSSNSAEMDKYKSSLDYILDTVPVNHKIQGYLSLLDVEGKILLVGAVPEPLQFSASEGRSISGSFIGSIQETQEILDFWVEKGLKTKIEVVKMDYVNKAFERMEKNDVRYRFVLDVAGSNLE